MDQKYEKSFWGEQVALPEILNRREQRVIRQNEILKKYKGFTLLSFTMNIAGPIKNNRIIYEGYLLGKRRLSDMFAAHGINILFFEEVLEKTGNEGIYVLDYDAILLKRLSSEIEDSYPEGRLYDMDVIDSDGNKIDRESIGLLPRSCLICKGNAKNCSRSRTHSIEELQTKTYEILSDSVYKEDINTIASFAVKALLYEVSITPKPGLVDRKNNGSHSDMDYFTFLDSASHLWPFFADCARAGKNTAKLPAQETLPIIKALGKAAETRMFGITKGINTHKGAIFSLGIVCAALGRLPSYVWKDIETVLSECGNITRGLIEHELKGLLKKTDLSGDETRSANTNITSGERFYLKYGITGIRGQAESGFPSVLNHGLPAIKNAIKHGYSLNDAGCIGLLYIIANETDTNLIARSNLETQKKMSQKIKDLLEKNPLPDINIIENLDEEFTSMNLSPGGSADLLAISYMMYFIETLL